MAEQGPNEHEQHHQESPEEVEYNIRYSRKLGEGLHNLLRLGYRTDTFSITKLQHTDAYKSNVNFWTSPYVKDLVIKCGKEINRVRYCEDNYSSSTTDPSEVFQDDQSCREEHWQAAECLNEDSPKTLEEVSYFHSEVDSGNHVVRRLASHIVIPRSWYEVTHACDPSGFTSPLLTNDPFANTNTARGERAANCIMKGLFSQQIRNYYNCDRSDCSGQLNELLQSWIALQLSRYNIKDDIHKLVFVDPDSQKANKILRWKKVNAIGGDSRLRNIENHPADHAIQRLLKTKRNSKYDWLPEVASSISKSLEREDAELDAMEDKEEDHQQDSNQEEENDHEQEENDDEDQ